MPKLTRKTQKIFCGSADNDQLAVFGSMATGTPVYTNDVEQLQGNAAYNQGWEAATLEDKAPFMEEMNGIQYSTSYQLAYLLQQGIAEWDSNTTYYTHSFVSFSDGNVYQSLQDNNIGNNPSSSATYWKQLNLNAANIDLSNLSAAGQAKFDAKADISEVDKKVNKSGDTMTGNLNINKAGGLVNITGTGYKGLTTKSTDIDYTLTNQVSLQGARILSNDKNGQWLGYFQNGIGSSGNIFTGISARRMINGTAKECALSCNVSTTGGIYTAAPTPPTGDNSTKIATTAYCVNMRCTTKATTTSSASTTRPCWVVQNYVNGTSWYRVWSDGWIEQGGLTASIAASVSTSVTFVKTFSNTQYTLCLSSVGNYSKQGEANDAVTSRTATGFSVTSGYAASSQKSWYACGY